MRPLDAPGPVHGAVLGAAGGRVGRGRRARVPRPAADGSRAGRFAQDRAPCRLGVRTLTTGSPPASPASRAARLRGSCSRTTSAGRSPMSSIWRGDCELPVVVDVFHHALAPSLDGLATRDLVLCAAGTWGERDGRQEVHFSTQEPGKRPGAHADKIDLEAFASFVDRGRRPAARLHPRGEGQGAVRSPCPNTQRPLTPPWWFARPQRGRNWRSVNVLLVVTTVG